MYIWFSACLLKEYFSKLSRQRDRQRKKAINSSNQPDWLRYKIIRNKVNNLKKHATEHFYNNLEKYPFSIHLLIVEKITGKLFVIL